MKRAIVSVTNDISSDQRVRRSCGVLRDNGYEVTVVGRIRPGSVNPDLPFEIHRFKLIFNKKALFYIEYTIRLFFFLLSRKADLYWSNDLDTLLPNYLVSRFRKKPIIYDSHEYFCHVPELENRTVVKKIWLSIEGFIFPKLNRIITVNKSIASCYEKEYGKRPLVIRNITSKKAAAEALSSVPERGELGLPDNIPVVIMQGAGINIHRGAEEAVLAMKEDLNCVLLFLGGGDAWEGLKKLVKEHKVEDKVIFIPRQNYGRMMQYSSHASVGLSLDKPNNSNYMMSLPNKLFDYIHAGVPVLATALPEIKKVFDEYDIGITIQYPDPKDIASALRRMLTDHESRKSWKINLEKAAEDLSWENERMKLDRMLEEL